MKELFKELSLASGAGGDEGGVRRIVRRELGGVVDDLRADRLGSLIATLRGVREDGPVLMLTAHMDEIGLMTTRIEDFGGIRFTKLGMIDDRMLISRLVDISTRTGKVSGVIGMPVATRLTAEEKTKPTPCDKLYVDVGSFSRAETEAIGIRVGDRITFRGDFLDLANNITVSKSVDDRIGLYALIETIKRLKDVKLEATIVAAFCAQHEVGSRGTITAAYSIHPDVSIHIDVAGHCPDDPSPGVLMGGGPVVRLMEDWGTDIHYGVMKGTIAHRDVVDLLIKCAAEHDLPYQLQISPGNISDQVFSQTSREGIMSSYILIPARYIHSQYECVKWDDVELAIGLTTAFATAVTRDFVDGAIDLDRIA